MPGIEPGSKQVIPTIYMFSCFVNSPLAKKQQNIKG